jgi:hypothetical protein
MTTMMPCSGSGVKMKQEFLKEGRYSSIRATRKLGPFVGEDVASLQSDGAFVT